MIDTESLKISLDRDIPHCMIEARKLYEEHGCFVARGLLQEAELNGIRKELQRLIGFMMNRAGITVPEGSPASFDEHLGLLYETAPELAENVFTAARRLTSVHSLSVHPRLLQVSQALMGTDMVMSSPYKPVRMDHPARSHMLLPWHQDYPYAQDSPDSIVYWIPLQDVDSENGCLRVAPGSHKLGILPVVMINPPPRVSNGIRGIALADPAFAEQQVSIELPMKYGDILVLSSLLLHRSQPNSTAQARWTFQVRHGNFANPQAIDRLWPRGHYERHWFDETHPEFVFSECVFSE